MTAVPRHVHQFAATPEEPEDPRNTLLDAFEQFAEALARSDLSLQARLRFERHIPAAPSVAHTQPAQGPEGADDSAKSDAQAAFAQAGTLGLTALIAELKRLEKLKMNALAHQAVQAVKAEAEASLAGLMKGEKANG